jgi:hypothetical protein
MDITSARYNTDILDNTKKVSINIIIGEQELSVPLDPANRHYAEIMRQVEAGDLTIAEAD